MRARLELGTTIPKFKVLLYYPVTMPPQTPQPGHHTPCRPINFSFPNSTSGLNCAKIRIVTLAGVYFSQTSVTYFCLGFSCCPYCRSVRKARVDCTCCVGSISAAVNYMHNFDTSMNFTHFSCAAWRAS